MKIALKKHLNNKMIPITRANFQSFCRICLREITATEVTYDVEQTLVRCNSLFPQKICHGCYIKTKTLKGFQDRAYCTTGILKFIVEERFNSKKFDNATLKQEMMDRLRNNFCRLCLKSNVKASEINEKIKEDINECIGLKIDEVVTATTCTDCSPLADDARYPHTICISCHTKLNGFVEYRRVTKQNMDYLQSLLDEDEEDDVEKLHSALDKSFSVTNKDREIKDTQIESIDLPITQLTSKICEDVNQKDLNELLSEPEVILSVEYCNKDSDFDSDDTKPLLLMRKSTKRKSNKSRRREARHQNQQRHGNKKKEYQEKHRKEIREERNPQSQESIQYGLTNKPGDEHENVYLQITGEDKECNAFETTLQNTNLEEVGSRFKPEVAYSILKNGLNKILSDHENQNSAGVDYNDFAENINSENSENSIILAPKEPTKTFKNAKSKLTKQKIVSETESNYELDNEAFESDSSGSSDSSYHEKEHKKQKLTKKKIIRKQQSSKEDKAKYKCEQCNKIFYKKHTIEAHMKSHEGTDKPFACKLCASAFTTYQALQRHINNNKHDTKTNENIRKTNNKQNCNKTSRECPSCHIEFERYVDLTDHIRKEHNGEKLFQCKICEKFLRTDAALNRHELNHSDERPYACQYCDKRYNYEAELKSHMQRHTANPALLCPICKKARANADDLEKHILSHSRPHQCPTCGKIFRKAYNLHQHEMAVHMKLRMHKCSQCGMSFKGRKDLYLHKFHHDPNGRPETCIVCGLHFKSKRALLRHMSKFHPSVEKPQELKQVDVSNLPNCCSKCPLRFKTKRGLLLHFGKSHKKGQRQVKTLEELEEKYGPRSQICTVCQLQCYSKRGLSRHIRKSHPDIAVVIEKEKLSNRIESCSMCPLKFRTARGLLLHKKRMHRKCLDYTDEECKPTLQLNWI